LLGLYWLYSSIRWLLARESSYEAIENALKIIRLETHLGIFHEPTIQGWIIDRAMWVIKFANTFYSFGYFPVLILTGALLYRFDRDRFHTFRLTFLLGLGFALICFSLFPLAPPRMLTQYGFVDTQQLYGSDIYNHKFVLSFYNPYAAMPSLHFGWALLVGIMACTLNRRPFKVAGMLYPCCMALVIVTTGHHYFLDIVGGGVVVGLAYTLVKVTPRVARELPSSPAGAKDNVPYKKTSGKHASTQPPAWHTDYRALSWSQRRDELARRHRHDTTLSTLLARRRPPL
jgi:hypothetical protein